MAVFLGFDFGMKRIGVAVGQSITRTASPLKTLPAQDGIPNWDHIAAVIQEWRPEALVVGIPLNMDGTEQPMTQAARRFSNRLKEKFRLPMVGVDERLTSWEAKQRLQQRLQQSRGKNKNKGKSQAAYIEDVNTLAAVLLLEDWMSQS